MGWVIFVIMVLAILIGSVFRGGRQAQRNFEPRQRNLDPRQDDPDARRPRRPMPPPVPRRRLVPPPLPRPRVLEAVEVVPVVRPLPQVQPVTLLEASPSVALKTATVHDKQQPAPAAAQLLDLLKDRKSLRASILLREVLAPPLCKRRGRV